MDKHELLAKVRKIEIKSRGISQQVFSGEYQSAFKGRGMAFSEVREYNPGDDIRLIDWNVTARLNHPFIKVFQEERELTVVLLVDMSASQGWGTSGMYKRDLAAELCAVLAFSALQNNDKIGVLFFSDKIEKFIPPKKGKSHILRIIAELLDFKPENKRTDIGGALKFLTNALKKRAIVFLISDFYAPPFEQALKVAAKKHDTIAIEIYDEKETYMPDAGLLRVVDSETGRAGWLDTSRRTVREAYAAGREKKQKELEVVLSRNKVDLVKIRTDMSYIAPLQNFFKTRGRRP